MPLAEAEATATDLHFVPTFGWQVSFFQIFQVYDLNNFQLKVLYSNCYSIFAIAI